jgi:hypothetical protein
MISFIVTETVMAGIVEKSSAVPGSDTTMSENSSIAGYKKN